MNTAIQYTAIAKDGGLFIPNIGQSLFGSVFTLEISKIEPAMSTNERDCEAVIGILKGVDGVAFQNSLREES